MGWLRLGLGYRNIFVYDYLKKVDIVTFNASFLPIKEMWSYVTLVSFDKSRTTGIEHKTNVDRDTPSQTPIKRHAQKVTRKKKHETNKHFTHVTDRLPFIDF